MQIALALYPSFTMLDIVGPFQVLADVPGNDVVFVAAQAGPVLDHTGRSGLVATTSFADVPAPEVVVVPGGLRDTELQAELVEWLRAVHPTTMWTTSVCTGAIYLAAAGILDGIDATTHWARKRALERLGAHYSDRPRRRARQDHHRRRCLERHRHGAVLLDRMYGPEMAQMIQLAIEYDPQPPFDAGSPAKAPAELVDLVQQMIGEGPTLPVTSSTGGA